MDGKFRQCKSVGMVYWVGHKLRIPVKLLGRDGEKAVFRIGVDELLFLNGATRDLLTRKKLQWEGTAKKLKGVKTKERLVAPASQVFTPQELKLYGLRGDEEHGWTVVETEDGERHVFKNNKTKTYRRISEAQKEQAALIEQRILARLWQGKDVMEDIVDWCECMRREVKAVSLTTSMLEKRTIREILLEATDDSRMVE